MMDEAAVLRAALRHDVLSAPIGFLLLGLGLAAGALALARRKNGDTALLARVAEWTGRSASFDDDLTFVVAGVTAITAES